MPLLISFPPLLTDLLSCSVSADKQYQLADWRIRPLPEEMIKYAREDTHYLLYIYDRYCAPPHCSPLHSPHCTCVLRLRNEALSRGNESANLLRNILDRSREICLQTYEKEIPNEESFRELYEKYAKFSILGLSPFIVSPLKQVIVLLGPQAASCVRCPV